MKVSKKWTRWNRTVKPPVNSKASPWPMSVDQEWQVSLWKASLVERLVILFTGRVWLRQANLYWPPPATALTGSAFCPADLVRHPPEHVGVISGTTEGGQYITRGDGARVKLTGLVYKGRPDIGREAVIPGDQIVIPGSRSVWIMAKDGSLYESASRTAAK